VLLHPGWFINADVRKVDFTDVTTSRPDWPAGKDARGYLARTGGAFSGLVRRHSNRVFLFRTARTLSDERGYEGESRPPTVRKLAEALGIDPRDLLADE
jgi:hypothetical protein